jgi:DNA repair protein RecO (recombination protein O)
MPLYTTDALILRTYQLGEADRIVVFLTSDRGKKRGVANGARRTKSRFGGGLEPLTLARLAYFERERRDLVRLSYVDPVRSPLRSSDASVLGHVGYFAELIDECAPEADPSETLFRLGAAVVESLGGDIRVDQLARYVEYWVLRLQGVYPSLLACHRCGGDVSGGGRLDPAEAGMSCRGCATGSGFALSTASMRFLREAAGTAPGAASGLTLPAPAARELERAHRQLISNHLEKELRSLRVLRAMTRDTQ